MYHCTSNCPQKSAASPPAARNGPNGTGSLRRRLPVASRARPTRPPSVKLMNNAAATTGPPTNTPPPPRPGLAPPPPPPPAPPPGAPKKGPPPPAPAPGGPGTGGGKTPAGRG